MLFLSFGVLTIKGLFSLTHLTRTLYDHPLVVSNASLNAAHAIAKMHRSMKDVVLSGSRQELDAALAEVAADEQVAHRQLDLVHDHILGEKGHALETEARELFDAWRPIRESVVRHLASGRQQEAVVITQTTGAAHVAELEAKMFELTSYARKKADSFLELVETRQSKLNRLTVILTCSGVVLSLVIAFIAISRVHYVETVLRDQKDALQKALDEINTLRGILPICSHCKKIRDDKGLWKQVEEYIRSHSEANFSHGICPDCARRHYPDIVISNQDDQ